MKLIVTLLVIWTLSACSSTNKKDDVMSGAGGVTDSDSVQLDGAEGGADSATFGLDDSGAVILDPLDDPASELFVRTIYFEYDSADLTEDSMSTVREHGRYLSSNPGRLVRLEGHADERGTREYNLALGELRAETVREILILEGAQLEQVEIVSFGEERPAVAGVDESALQLNRRVEIVY